MNDSELHRNFKPHSDFTCDTCIPLAPTDRPNPPIPLPAANANPEPKSEPLRHSPRTRSYGLRRHDELKSVRSRKRHPFQGKQRRPGPTGPSKRTICMKKLRNGDLCVGIRGIGIKHTCGHNVGKSSIVKLLRMGAIGLAAKLFQRL